MLDTLKEAGMGLGRELERTWGSLSHGWRELLRRGGNALPHPAPIRRREIAENSALAAFPRRGLLASEVEETGREILLRVPMPGMDPEDCQVTIEGNMLFISADRRYQREIYGGTCHLKECAYGSFRRVISLPCSVDSDKAEAHCRNGALTVRVPKINVVTSTAVPVS